MDGDGQHWSQAQLPLANRSRGQGRQMSPRGHWPGGAALGAVRDGGTKAGAVGSEADPRAVAGKMSSGVLTGVGGATF